MIFLHAGFVCVWLGDRGSWLYIHILCIIKTTFVNEFEEYIYTVFNILLPTRCTALFCNRHMLPLFWIKEINKKEINVEVVINNWNLYILCILAVCPNPYTNWFMLKRLKGMCHEMNIFLMACNYKSEHSFFIVKKIKWQVFTCFFENTYHHISEYRGFGVYSINKTWSRQNVPVTRVNTASWVTSCSSPNSFSNPFISVKIVHTVTRGWKISYWCSIYTSARNKPTANNDDLLELLLENISKLVPPLI